MNFEFFYPKKKFERKDISKAYIFLKNGDFLEIRKNEFVEISVNFYDNLIWNFREASPVVESGFIKLRIQDRKAKYEYCFLYNPKEYTKSRKEYIESRLIKEGLIERICIFDENSWHDTLFGDAYAELEGDYLFIRYQPNNLYGSYTNENNTINLGVVSKSIIEKINLDFENCESFEIYKEEIVDIQLNFYKKLDWNSSGFARTIRDGFIRLKLNPQINWRKINLANEWQGKKTKGIAPLKKRLVWKNNRDEIDICHLYITYDYAGYCINREECIEINDIRPDEYFDNLEKEDTYDNTFISGYAEMQNDDSILIVFGKELPK